MPESKNSAPIFSTPMLSPKFPIELDIIFFIELYKVRCYYHANHHNF